MGNRSRNGLHIFKFGDLLLLVKPYEFVLEEMLAKFRICSIRSLRSRVAILLPVFVLTPWQTWLLGHAMPKMMVLNFDLKLIVGKEASISFYAQSCKISKRKSISTPPT